MSLPSKYLLWYHDGLPPLAVSPVVIFFHEEREQDKNQRDNTVEQSLTHELVRKAKKREASNLRQLFSLLGAPHLIEKSFQALGVVVRLAYALIR